MTDSPDDPYALFAAWFDEAKGAEPNDPNAMTLATADEAGAPDARMVLLKGVEAEGAENGFVFYTNLESAKGTQLAANPQAAICLHWKSLRRQVRARGPIAPVSDAAADAYFASRPRGSQIGAWASRQSRPMAGRFELEAAVAKTTAKYAIGSVPRPPHWSGFRLAPLQIEFWADRPFRLHERRVFTRDDPTRLEWREARLFP